MITELFFLVLALSALAEENVFQFFGSHLVAVCDSSNYWAELHQVGYPFGWHLSCVFAKQVFFNFVCSPEFLVNLLLMLYHLVAWGGTANRNLLFVKMEKISARASCYSTVPSVNTHLSSHTSLSVVCNCRLTVLHGQPRTPGTSANAYSTCKRFAPLQYSVIDECMQNPEKVGAFSFVFYILDRKRADPFRAKVP